MVRLSLAAVEKRIAKLEARARLLNAPPLVLIDLSTWDEADLDAYRKGTEADRIALEDQHAGPLPNELPDNPEGIVAIVVGLSPYERPDGDDDDEIGPRPLTPEERRSRIREIHARAESAAANDAIRAEEEEQQRYLEAVRGW